MNRLLLISLFFCLGITTGQAQSAVYEAVPCPAALVSIATENHLEGVAYTCGVLKVPENRHTPSSRQIELAVSRLQPTQPNDQPPIIYLAGGPGGSALGDIALWLDSALLAQHEIILLEQRGTAFSRPSLMCPELSNTAFRPVAACAQRLRDEGVDLAAYNTSENAADVADLIHVLDLASVNLIGQSYGTRLALAVLRDHPERVHAVILDAVYPTHASVYEGRLAAAQRALDALFADCAADAACNASYPDLEATFYRLLSRLDSSPQLITLSNYGAQFYYNDDYLIQDMMNWLYITDEVPLLPGRIMAFFDGDFSYYNDLILEQTATPISMGFYFSVQCQEEIPVDDIESVLRGDGRSRFEVSDPLRRILREQFASCLDWDVPTAAAYTRAPVTSDRPVLLMSGRYDPITPPEWAQQAAGTLTNSQHVIFQNGAHGVINHLDCADRIAAGFFLAPFQAVEAGCASQTPEWVLANP